MNSPGVSIIDKHEHYSCTFESSQDIARALWEDTNDDRARWVWRALKEAEDKLTALGATIVPSTYKYEATKNRK